MANGGRVFPQCEGCDHDGDQNRAYCGNCRRLKEDLYMKGMTGLIEDYEKRNRRKPFILSREHSGEVFYRRDFVREILNMYWKTN